MSASNSLQIEWKWTDYQRDVRDALESTAYDLVVFRTGYGGGKSITGSQWIHRGALQLEGRESMVMGQDFQKAEATTFKVFFETLPGEYTVPNDAEGVPENSPIVAGYNEVKKRLTYVTGPLHGSDRRTSGTGTRAVSSTESGVTRSPTTRTPTSTSSTKCSSLASAPPGGRIRPSGRVRGMGSTSSTT